MPNPFRQPHKRNPSSQSIPNHSHPKSKFVLNAPTRQPDNEPVSHSLPKEKSKQASYLLSKSTQSHKLTSSTSSTSTTAKSPYVVSSTLVKPPRARSSEGQVESTIDYSYKPVKPSSFYPSTSSNDTAFNLKRSYENIDLNTNMPIKTSTQKESPPVSLVNRSLFSKKDLIQQHTDRNYEKHRFSKYRDQAQFEFKTDGEYIKKGPSGQALESIIIEKQSRKRRLGEASNDTNETQIPHELRFRLSPEQQVVADLVIEKNKSLFFTGNAGTGKSFLLKHIIHLLRSKYSMDEVAVTASTGLAACNIGGQTLHSFAGVGLGKRSVSELLSFVHKNKRVYSRWKTVKVLLVDEVSMLDIMFFEKLEELARCIRMNNMPFGGIQLIFSGDFMQLPAVNSANIKFCFESSVWSKCFPLTIELRTIFRQKDSLFIKILNEMRHGNLSDESIRIMKTLSRPLYFEDGIEPPELYSTRKECDMANSTRLSALAGSVRTFKAKDSGVPLDSNILAPEILHLKPGCQVMLVKNLDFKLVNGTIGKVTDFSENNYPIVDFSVKGQIITMEIKDEAFTIESSQGTIQSQRIQLPLTLAYAMSIHKSQGQTLDRLKVDLAKVFEIGQAYTAISRCVSLDNLQVLNFDTDKVKSHHKVIAFCRQLKGVDDIKYFK